jgi:Na+/H+ antiporter NhaC
MASATDHIDHVRTQLPYALLCAGGSMLLFLVFGFLL